jgi:tetratricopeptide (TPR) repeat protein
MTFDPNSFFVGQSAISLSDLLDQLEIDLSHIGQGDRTRAEKMLVRMDVVNQKINRLAESQIPVTAETAQFEYIRQSLERNGRSFLKDVGGMKSLLELRGKVKPASNRSWWFIEQSIARQKGKSLHSIGLTLGIIAIITLFLVILFNTILKPDPIIVARYSHESNAEQFLAKNDPTSALAEINEALTLGQDAHLLILRAVILYQVGQKEEASVDFVSAEDILGDRNTFLLARAETWLRVGRFEYALLDTQEVIRSDPESAQAYFYNGKAQELNKDYSGAINAYQKASELAGQQDKAELNATIRMSMAMLMQSIPPDISVTRQPTP